MKTGDGVTLGVILDVMLGVLMDEVVEVLDVVIRLGSEVLDFTEFVGAFDDDFVVVGVFFELVLVLLLVVMISFGRSRLCSCIIAPNFLHGRSSS